MLFQESKKSQLASYEDIEEKTRELKQQSKGYFSKLITKIIDNIQVKIENVYIRIEDDLSYPTKPFAFGFVLKLLTAFTTDKKWNFNYVADSDENYKAISLRNFSFFCNYSDKKAEVFIDLIRGNSDDKTFSDFAQLECNSGRLNRYILNGLNIDLRLVLNKEPKKNSLPEIKADLRIGSTFAEDTPGPVGKPKTEGRHLVLLVEKDQITVFLKFFEYAGKYTEFQKKALSKFYTKRFFPSQKEGYSKLYITYLLAKRQKNKKVTSEKKKELAKFEEEFNTKYILQRRAIEKRRLEHLERKAERDKDISKKMQELDKKIVTARTKAQSILLLFN